MKIKVKKEQSQNPSAPKRNIVKVPDIKEVDSLIKSARCFTKNAKIHIDYRTAKARFRFSTGAAYTKRNLSRIKRDAYALALEHFLSKNEVLDDNVYFEDIGLKAIAEDKGNRQEDTHTDYVNIFNNFVLPYFQGMLLADITVSDIKAWSNELLSTVNLSKSRYRIYHRVVGFIFKYAYLNDMIERDLMKLVPIRSKLFTNTAKNSSKKYYTPQEAKLIMMNATGWFKVFITTLFNTGIRTGEALALSWDDIDFTNNLLLIRRSVRKGIIKQTTKTGVNRQIDMNEPLKLLLLSHKEHPDTHKKWLFPNPKTGNLYTEPKSIILWQFKPLLQKLGIEYRTLYATRHTFASSAVQSGIPITYIQRQLGHSKLSTTTDYYIKNGLLGKEVRDIRADSLYAC